MKAMIFAAGMGTRLGLLTDNKPKALVEVNGKPMLAYVIEYLKSYGVRDIVINVHHFAGQIKDYLLEQNNFGSHIEISDESDELLDTGGGLIKASSFFDDGQPFVAHNADILSQTNLNEVLQLHTQSKSLATLVVKNRISSRYLLINKEGYLCGWRNTQSGNEIIVRQDEPLKEVAFSGIQIINPELFNLNMLAGKFSLTKMYLGLAQQNNIATFVDNGLWFDLGKPENINEAESKFFKR